MSLLAPFAALRPAPGRAAEVAAPPYDVMSEAEARAMVAGRPWSFLHVSRPEVDLPTGTDPHADVVYAQARANLARMCDDGVLVQDPAPRFYVYRLTLGTHRQTGLVGVASVAAYEAGRIRRHELTRPAKEDDRVRQIDAVNAQTGPVFLVYRARPAIDAVLAATAATAPEVDIEADGVRHEVWSITAAEPIAALTAAFDAVPMLYIADGHHRAAAAARVAAARRAVPGAGPSSADAAHEAFLAVCFPDDQMQILPNHRVVRDLNGLDARAFRDRLAAAFQVEPAPGPFAPSTAGTFGLYLDGAWWRLRLDPALIPAHDPVARLDVALLQTHLIGPILGITDPRRDERIDFVGGIRGLPGLAARVDSGEMRAAFALAPTRIADLLAVADADALMPPKSTWFEPKLADGLLSHRLGPLA